MSRVLLPLLGGLDGIRNIANTVVKAAGSIFDRSINDSTFGMNSNEYNFDYKVFPEDLANDNNGHYMVININVPVSELLGGGASRSAFVGSQLGTTFTSRPEYSKVDVLRFGNLPPIPGAPDARQRENLALKRGTRRIKESIALFMPSSLVYSSQNKYEEISMTAIAGNIGKAGLQMAAGLATGAISQTLAGSLKRGAAGKTLSDGLGNSIGTVASIAGYPINPRVEVLYSTTPQREFVFEILMAPKSENESIAVEQIIQALRFHAAPEIDKLSFIGGFTFVPPAEFDITFFNKGVENNHIPRINTCVLERIEVDYAPTGVYSTFRNGHPVAVRLSLGFREIEIIHKERILRGF
jgi:hypothetical protein